MKEIPNQLKKYPNWVGWKSIVRDGKATKVPFDVKTGQRAKADDPATWTTFDQAFAATDVLSGSDYSGLGFELGGTDLVGIDFDGSIDKKGVIDSYASVILDLLDDPYTETSPSGKGLHAFVECAALPEGGRKMSQGHIGIEIYHGREGGRYLTMTGTRVRGNSVPKIADISLPYLLITQNKDKKFRNLWLGDTSYFDGDESSADMALMNRLAVLTNGDAAKMETFFGASALGKREKWIDREDYRQRTIKAALEYNQTGKIVTALTDIEFHSAAYPDPDGDCVIAPQSGHGDGWFPLGDISLIGGASGTGKTSFIFDMLHRQRDKKLVLDHTTFGYSFHVLAYDRGKNSVARTLRRLRMSPIDIPMTPLPLAFGSNAVQNIINEIEKMTPTPNIIFVEGLDMLIDDANKKAVVSPFMRQLQEVAAHFHTALIGSVGAPKTKRGEDYAAKRDHLSGSEAWGRNCETVAILEFSEDDDGTAPQRSFTVLPRNAPAEKFSLQFESGRLVPIQPTVEAETAKNGRPSESLQVAINFIYSALQSGPVSGKYIIKNAHDLENITRSTLYRAAKLIGVRMHSAGGTTLWEMDALNETATKFVTKEML